MQNILKIIQAATAVVLIVSILLQQRGTALGSSLGGGGDSFYSTRRGLQKKLLWVTIFSGVLFIVLSLINLII